MKNKQKYKRCMAKAEACMHKRWRTDEGFDYARSTRHMNKWLELAEKFKEANDDYVKEARFKLNEQAEEEAEGQTNFLDQLTED